MAVQYVFKFMKKKKRFRRSKFFYFSLYTDLSFFVKFTRFTIPLFIAKEFERRSDLRTFFVKNNPLLKHQNLRLLL